MKLENEREEKIYRFDLDVTDEERRAFLTYADNNMTQEELEALKIEWAVVDMLKKAVGLKGNEDWPESPCQFCEGSGSTAPCQGCEHFSDCNL